MHSTNFLVCKESQDGADGQRRGLSDGNIQIHSVHNVEFTSAGVHKVVIVIMVGSLSDEMVQNLDGIDVG